MLDQNAANLSLSLMMEKPPLKKHHAPGLNNTNLGSYQNISSRHMNLFRNNICNTNAIMEEIVYLTKHIIFQSWLIHGILKTNRNSKFDSNKQVS